jgi:hypothetical protein
MDLLRSLGFQPDHTIVSYDPSTITFDFGILKLKATSCINLRAAEIVLFSGVISTPRSLGEVHFELPRRVESRKQCAAWIVWNLDQFTDFQKIKHIGWVEEGRRSQWLLPWVKRLAQWNARPKVTVKRDWLRLALKIPADKLRRLLKRLIHENIEISIWESRISIGGWTYAGTLDGFGATDRSAVQYPSQSRLSQPPS